MHCPECKEPIHTPKQIRCDNCELLFDWDDEEIYPSKHILNRFVKNFP